MSKFTPAPWEYERENLRGCYWIHQKGVTRQHVKTNNEANARLIAAAPEMYELLKSLVDILFAHSYSRDKAISIVNLLACIDGEEESDD